MIIKEFSKFNIKKVSFDFDHTLSEASVQEFVKEIINDFEIWIVTSRETKREIFGTDPVHFMQLDNSDLFLVADSLGIKRSNIVFTEHQLKADYIIDTDIIAHLDDDHIELKFINDETKTKGFSVKSKNWENDLKEYIYSYSK